MPTTEQTAMRQETWHNWLRHITSAQSRDDFIEGINQEYDINLTAEQIQSWEDRGLLPRPIQDNLYPHNAELVIRALQDFERERGGVPPETEEVARGLLRAFAKAIDETAGLDIRDHLTEMLQEEVARRATWVDWMPPGSSMPELLSHDELLKELQDRSVDVSSVALEHWRKSGVLPRPVRRWHQGATRPVYPRWFVGAIARLRQLQQDGWTLEEIKPVMQSWALGDEPLQTTALPSDTDH